MIGSLSFYLSHNSPEIKIPYSAIAYKPFFGFWSASGQKLIVFVWPPILLSGGAAL